MPEKTSQDQPIPALEEFRAIRNVLRVPFPEDLRDLTPPELPEDRQWNGPCLGYPPIIIGVTSATPTDKPKTEKKT